MLLSALLLFMADRPPARGAQMTVEGAPTPFHRLTSERDCRTALPQLLELCGGRAFDGEHVMEIASADLDEDGREDVAIRYRSLFECGSHGCRTDIYLAGPGRIPRNTGTDLVTDGSLVRCRVGRAPGLAFPDRGPGFACFTLPDVAAPAGQDGTPSKASR